MAGSEPPVELLVHYAAQPKNNGLVSGEDIFGFRGDRFVKNNGYPVSGQHVDPTLEYNVQSGDLGYYGTWHGTAAGVYMFDNEGESDHGITMFNGEGDIAAQSSWPQLSGTNGDGTPSFFGIKTDSNEGAVGLVVGVSNDSGDFIGDLAPYVKGDVHLEVATYDVDGPALLNPDNDDYEFLGLHVQRYYLGNIETKQDNDDPLSITIIARGEDVGANVSFDIYVEGLGWQNVLMERNPANTTGMVCTGWKGTDADLNAAAVWYGQYGLTEANKTALVQQGNDFLVNQYDISFNSDGKNHGNIKPGDAFGIYGFSGAPFFIGSMADTDIGNGLTVAAAFTTGVEAQPVNELLEDAWRTTIAIVGDHTEDTIPGMLIGGRPYLTSDYGVTVGVSGGASGFIGFDGTNTVWAWVHNQSDPEVHPFMEEATGGQNGTDLVAFDIPYPFIPYVPPSGDIPTATLADLANAGSTINAMPSIGSNGLVSRSRPFQVAVADVDGVLYVSKCHFSAWQAFGRGKVLNPKGGIGPLIVIPQ